MKSSESVSQQLNLEMSAEEQFRLLSSIAIAAPDPASEAMLRDYAEKIKDNPVNLGLALTCLKRLTNLNREQSRQLESALEGISYGLSYCYEMIINKSSAPDTVKGASPLHLTSCQTLDEVKLLLDVVGLDHQKFVAAIKPASIWPPRPYQVDPITDPYGISATFHYLDSYNEKIFFTTVVAAFDPGWLEKILRHDENLNVKTCQTLLSQLNSSQAVNALRIASTVYDSEWQFSGRVLAVMKCLDNATDLQAALPFLEQLHKRHDTGGVDMTYMLKNIVEEIEKTSGSIPADLRQKIQGLGWELSPLPPVSAVVASQPPAVKSAQDTLTASSTQAPNAALFTPSSPRGVPAQSQELQDLIARLETVVADKTASELLNQLKQSRATGNLADVVPNLKAHAQTLQHIIEDCEKLAELDKQAGLVGKK